MARQDAFDDPLAGSHAASGTAGPLAPVPASSSWPSASSSSGPTSSWRNLVWLSVAAAGVGFAGYLYLMPYRQLTGTLETRSRELRQEREEGRQLTAERDQLKTGFDKFESTEKDRTDRTAKAQREMEALAAQLKPALQELGASVGTARGHLLVSLAPEKAIDKNGIDVSSEGSAVLKILAGAIKRTGGTARIKAKFSSGPAPKQLRSLFATAGEVSAVRAARVMSALEGAGLSPDRLAIVGEDDSAKEAPKVVPRGASKRRRAAAAAAAAGVTGGDRLDIEVEPG